MKTWQEHVDDLVNAIVTCRDLCGNESECVREYLADNGFSKGSINAMMIADKARIEAARLWDVSRQDAGVQS